MPPSTTPPKLTCLPSPALRSSKAMLPTLVNETVSPSTTPSRVTLPSEALVLPS